MNKQQILRDTAWLLSSYVIKLGLQAISFVLMAKYLGPSDFGLFSVLFSLCSMLAPFVELGSYYLVIKDINSGVSPQDAIGLALKASMISGVVVFMMIFAIKSLFIPQIDALLFYPVAIAVIFLNRFQTIMAGYNATRGQLWRNSLIDIAGGLTLIIFIYISLQQTEKNLIYWAFFSQYAVVAFFSILQIMKLETRINLSYGKLSHRIKEGLSFAIGIFSYGANNETDKVLMPNFVSLNILGQYSVSSRIMVMSHIPLNAFLGATYPKLNSIFHSNKEKFLLNVRNVWYITLVYGLVVSGSVFFFSRYLPIILGEQYADAGEMLAIASALIILQAAQFPMSDYLNITGFWLTRSIIQTVAFLVSLGLNLCLIPTFSWLGSIIALYVSTSLSLLFLTVFCLKKNRSSSKVAVVE